MGDIVQFCFGGDGLDPTYMEGMVYENVLTIPMIYLVLVTSYDVTSNQYLFICSLLHGVLLLLAPFYLGSEYW